MHILLAGRGPRLEDWESRPFWPMERRPGDHLDEHVREVGLEAPGPPASGGLHARLAERILAYRVFPEGLLRGVLRRAPVEVGDVVGGVYHLLPGVRLFFASRVVDRFDAPRDGWWRTGFTYRTLHGHPELGEETFSVEKALDDGRVRVALRAWSRPGTRLARLGAPLARRLQLQASRAALDALQAAANTAYNRPDPQAAQAAEAARG